MTAITFPNSPSSGDTHTAGNGIVYTYDGEKWTSIGTNSAGTWTRSGTEVSLTNAGDDLNVDSGTLFVDASTDRVGIGTTSPQFFRLEVNGTDGVESTIFASASNLAADAGGTIAFGGAYTGSTLTSWADIKGAKENATDGQYGGYLRFNTRPHNGLSTERIRITSSGDVGIGTSSPQTYGNPTYNTLDVVGTNGGVIQSTSGNSAVKTYFYSDSSNSTGRIGTVTNHPFLLVSNSVERMRIDSSGNVGIGRTPDTTYTIYPFQIRSQSSNGSFIHLSRDGDGTTVSGDGMVVGLGITESYVFTRENLPLVFGTNDVEEMRVLPGGGLTFNGDTSQANALDDYEEGTWTPVVQGSSGAGTATYVYQVGDYVKIGRMVHIRAYLQWNSATGTGALLLNGLPYTVSGSLAYGGPAINYWHLMATGPSVSSLWNLNTTYMSFYTNSSSNGSAASVLMDPAGAIIVSGAYYV